MECQDLRASLKNWIQKIARGVERFLNPYEVPHNFRLPETP